MTVAKAREAVEANVARMLIIKAMGEDVSRNLAALQTQLDILILAAKVEQEEASVALAKAALTRAEGGHA